MAALLVLALPGRSQCEIGKLLASSGAEGDWFGGATAISGSTLIIGAPQDDDVGSTSGSAWVFVRVGGAGWHQQAKLLPDPGNGSSRFGFAVALSGDTAVIGAPQFNAHDYGAIHVFERQGASWNKSLFHYGGLVEDSEFGKSVSIHGETFVVGAPGTDSPGNPRGAA